MNRLKFGRTLLTDFLPLPRPLTSDLGLACEYNRLGQSQQVRVIDTCNTVFIQSCFLWLRAPVFNNVCNGVILGEKSYLYLI